LNPADRRLWPYSTRASLYATVVVFLGLTLLVVALRIRLGWPSDGSEGTLLVGVPLLSLVPLFLVLVDAMIRRGGAIEVPGVKLVFAQVQNARIEGVRVPANISTLGTLVEMSDPDIILDALGDATESDVVVINLEDGNAWVETRLLVLLEGADRLGKPRVVVFVGMGNGNAQRLQGWGYADELLRAMLHPVSDDVRAKQYRRFVQQARAAGNQWDLVAPQPPDDGPDGPPSTLPWPDSVQRNDERADPPLATHYSDLAFDSETGDRDHLFVEKALASELSIQVEQKWAEPRWVTLGRLGELFGDALRHRYVDQCWSDAEQNRAFLKSDDEHLVLTGPEGYEGIVPRVTVLNEYVRVLVEHATCTSDGENDDCNVS
jgi:hypothetical protein